MGEAYVMAIDHGTTGSRAIVINRRGEAVSVFSKTHRQIYPNPGWVSHDAAEIFNNVLDCVNGALVKASVQPDELAAIGISNQRETVVAWDKVTGEPVCDALVWQCRRTADICKKAESDGLTDVVREKTGLVIDPYFSATKIKWIFENIPEARSLADKGRLLAGTMDSYIIWRLTDGEFVTDYSNASRTMLFNINTLRWDDDLLKYFGVPAEILPKVVPTSGYFGKMDILGTPITSAAGDQQASLFGHLCHNNGDMKNTYGTGCFILKNIGTKPVISKNKLLTTIAWNMNGETVYALEGSVFDAGSALEWLIRDLGLVRDIEEVDNIAKSTHDTGGVYFVPAFSGLGAPHWDMYARGLISGMSFATDRKKIIRALIESIAFQSTDVIKCMDIEAGAAVNKLRADGGVSKSDIVMQFQADLLQIPVERPKNTETTALGAAYLAGLAAGFWKDIAEITETRSAGDVFSPSMPAGESEKKYAMWLKAVARAKSG